MRGLLLVALAGAVCACSKPMQLQARCALLLAALVLLCSCKKPIPLTATCEPEPLQHVRCSARSIASADVFLSAGNVEERALDDGDPVFFDLSSAPLGVDRITAAATDRAHERTAVTMSIPTGLALRYRFAVDQGDDGARRIRFELPAGATLASPDRAVTAGSNGAPTLTVDAPESLPAAVLGTAALPAITWTIRGGGVSLTDRYEPNVNSDWKARLQDAIWQHAPLAWAAPLTRGKSARAALVMEHGRDRIRAMPPSAALAQVEVVVDTEDGYDIVETCGAYRRGDQFGAVNRIRDRTTLAFYEARTGKLLGKKILYGSTPRSCRDKEMLDANTGYASIDGDDVPPQAIDAAIAAWAAH